MAPWILAVLRALGIRRAADVVPVAAELGDQLRNVVDPPEPGQPLPYSAVAHQRSQIASATAHKVQPSGEPRTGNPPARVVAASAPAAGAVCEAPGGAGAAGTQGAVRCAACLTVQLQVPGGWGCPNATCAEFCELTRRTPRPGLVKAVNRNQITPREGTLILAPPRPRKEPDK